LGLDRRNVRALIVLADLLSVRVLVAGRTDREADIRRADSLVSLAVRSGPLLGPYIKAAVLLLQKRPQAALVEADRSLALNPSFGPAYQMRCTAHRVLGSPEKSLEYADQAIRLTHLQQSARSVAESCGLFHSPTAG
jgi:adenylate cyclase